MVAKLLHVVEQDTSLSVIPTEAIQAAMARGAYLHPEISPKVEMVSLS